MNIVNVENIETLVAESVNTVMTSCRKDVKDLACKEMVLSSNNLPNAIARQFLYRTLHDCYGVSYGHIAKITTKSSGGIMKAVRKVRFLMQKDQLFIKIKQEIERRINGNEQNAVISC